VDLGEVKGVMNDNEEAVGDIGASRRSGELGGYFGETLGGGLDVDVDPIDSKVLILVCTNVDGILGGVRFT
jgi:hypothetical protein